MSLALAEMTEKLISISEFSQGKAGKIFTDVAKNRSEYIVLKNNQPTAVVVSVEEYRDTQRKVARLERILEMVENMRLLKLAEQRDNTKTMDFEAFVKQDTRCGRCSDHCKMTTILDFDNLVRKNMMNVKDGYKKNPCTGVYDSDFDSYCSLVSFEEFKKNYASLIQKADTKRSETYKYELKKNMNK